MSVTIHDMNVVEYLHDSRVTAITWDCSDRNVRCITMSISVDPELEFKPLRGKAIRLNLSNVLAAQFMGWGHLAGDETIDTWRVGIENSLEQELTRMESLGLSVPCLRFTVTFRSGSLLQVACSELSFDEECRG